MIKKGMISSGLISILISFLNNVLGVFIAISTLYLGYSSFYLNKFSFIRENFSYHLAKLAPSFIGIWFSIGTITYPIFDYF